MPNPRQIVPWAKLLALPPFVWFALYLAQQVYSQTPLTPTTADFAISALPFVSEETPAIDQQLVIWYDDRKGPTDVWAYDLNAHQTFALTSQRDAQFIADLSGDLLAYEDNRNGTWDIYGLRRSTGEEFAIASGPHHQRYPQVWGEYVVYQDETAQSEESNVYLYHRATGETKPLAVATGYQGSPAIDNNWVVWVDRRTGVTQLGIYNLVTQVQEFRAIDCDQPCQPRLSGDEVVWSGNRAGNADIYLYNLVTKTESTIYTGPGDQLNPAVSPELIVWQDKDTYGNWNVFVYVRATQQHFPVTTAASEQIRPVVTGNTVVWQDNRNHSWDIYGFVWNGEIPPLPNLALPNPRQLQVGAYPAGAIHLTWLDESDNEQSFRIERTTGILSTTWVELATLPANTTEYVDTTTQLGQSYWYRVQAVGPAGASTYSNESYSTAVDNVPNLDERYLHLLINELRMAPTVWQHAEITPLDPVGWDPNLAYSARAHAVGMNNSHCCQGHIDLAGRGAGERAAASGYPYEAAENLFQAQSGRTGIEEAHQGFIDSPPHLANMIDPNTRQLAIGFAPGARGTLVEVFSAGPPGVVVPPLPSGIVVPYEGKPESDFDFLVSFANPGQQPPSGATVEIDGVSFPMTLRSGVAGRGTYAYRTKLRPGNHAYAFVFTWGSPGQTARLPATGTFTGPWVHPPLPDLQAEVRALAPMVVGREQNVQINLLNLGEKAANKISVGLYRDHPQLGGVLIGKVALTGALPPTGRESVIIPWRAETPGGYILYAWVDTEETEEETDESNNLATALAQVRSQAQLWFVDGAAQPGGDGLTAATAWQQIAPALAQAALGDTIWVAAGSYPGPLVIPPGVHLAGAGYPQTTIQGNGQGSVVELGDQSTISGFTITGSGAGAWDAGVRIDAQGTATVRNNRLTGNHLGVIAFCLTQPCPGRSLVHNNLIDHQQGSGIDTYNNAQLVIVNNTIADNNERGIDVDAANTIVRNNLIVGNKSASLYAENSLITLEYNNFWNNGADVQGATPGTGNLSVDPLWVAPPAGNYELSAASPCLNAGDPAREFRDVDGSRNDMGAAGGPGVTLPLPTVTPTPPANATVVATPTLPVGTPTEGGADQPGVYLPLVRR